VTINDIIIVDLRSRLAVSEVEVENMIPKMISKDLIQPPAKF
jgi:hypothetical protein